MILTEEQILEMGSALEHSGFVDEEIDAYLEHYGVKGMKWGVRKERRQERRAQRKTERRRKAKKAAVGLGVGAALGAGAIATTAVLKRRGQTPVKEAAKMDWRAAGKGWFVETNNAKAFEITMAELSRRRR